MAEIVKNQRSRSGRRPIMELNGRHHDDLELLARTFRVLGDETRLHMLAMLGDAEYTQADLVRELGLTQSRVSEHLACLEWCGFVKETRVEGRRRYFKAIAGGPRKVISVARAHLEANQAGIASCRRAS